jgi:hypothetical protein
VFNLFGGNLLAEQRGNDVVHGVAIYEAGQSLDTNSWFPKSGFGARTVLIEIGFSGRRLPGGAR